jgi:hypothetical protein
MENTLTKLDALNKLANAYRYVHAQRGADCYAAVILEDTFHMVRRSLQNIEELLLKDASTNEGLNGRMPTHF